jgi:hypothetical protein
MSICFTNRLKHPTARDDWEFMTDLECLSNQRDRRTLKQHGEKSYKENEIEDVGRPWDQAHLNLAFSSFFRIFFSASTQCLSPCDELAIADVLPCFV